MTGCKAARELHTHGFWPAHMGQPEFFIVLSLTTAYTANLLTQCTGTLQG